MEFTTEEGQDIFGAEAAGGMLQQLFIEAGQGRTISKQDIQGQFTLVADPVVTIARQDRIHQRIGASGEGLQDAGPVFVSQAAGEALGPGQVLDLGEGVVDAVVVDPVVIHLPGQPGMAVDIDLDGKGHPCLPAGRQLWSRTCISPNSRSR